MGHAHNPSALVECIMIMGSLPETNAKLALHGRLSENRRTPNI